MRILLSLVLAVSGYFTFDVFNNNDHEDVFKYMHGENSDYEDMFDYMNGEDGEYGDMFDHMQGYDDFDLFGRSNMWDFEGQSEEVVLLREMVLEFYETFDWDNMTDEEISLAMIEIQEYTLFEADKLDIDVDSLLSNYMFDGGFGMHGSFSGGYDYMLVYRDLYEEYDWSNMTSAERLDAIEEIENILAEEYSDSFFGGHMFGGGFGMRGMFSNGSYEYMEVYHELYEEYDWSNMSTDDRLNALEEIEITLAEQYPDLEFGQMWQDNDSTAGFRGFGRGCH